MITIVQYVKDSSEDVNNLMYMSVVNRVCNTLTLQQEKVNVTLGKTFEM